MLVISLGLGNYAWYHLTCTIYIASKVKLLNACYSVSPLIGLQSRDYLQDLKLRLKTSNIVFV